MTSLDFSKINELAEKKGRPFNILVVDDEKWIRDVYRNFCELTDALNLDVALSGEEAIGKVNDTVFDLITLDLIMPEMSGLEVLNSIKQVTPKVPIMIITGNATDRLVNEAGVMGACRVLYKPVMLEDLLEEITSALDKKITIKTKLD
jgi:two-component system, chemotaxis family, chemotaxis protein CheY